MQKVPPLPTIQEIIRLYGLTARKKLAQNFLLDMNLTRKIVRTAGKLENAFVIEVGPGPGGITRAILNTKAAKVFVVEKDKRFMSGLQILQEHSCGRLIPSLGDVLDYNFQSVIPPSYAKDWEDEPPNIHIIGNLPFNIATPLIVRWFRSMSMRSNAWAFGRVKLTLTFQKEVAERMIAPPFSKHRCRMSVACQNVANPDLKFIIPGKAFVPAPKVDVGVVEFEPKIKPLFSQSFDFVNRLITHVFQHPNKPIEFSLAHLFPPEQDDLLTKLINTAHVDPEIPGFQLLNEDFKKLCDVYEDIVKEYPDLFTYNYIEKKEARRRRNSDIHVSVIEKQILEASLNDQDTSEFQECVK